MKARRIIRSVGGLLRPSWKRLVAIHVAVSLLSVFVLAPLFAALLGWLVLTSGDAALTDEDILYFVLSPRGALVFVLLASIQLTLAVTELAAVIMAASSVPNGRRVRWVVLGKCLLDRLFPVFRLSMRLVVRLGVLAAPFALTIFLLYREVLGTHDINYYLAYKPSEFWWAAAGAMVLLAVMALIWLRAVAAFLVALPLVMLGDGEKASVRVEQARTAVKQHRAAIFSLLVLWFVGTLLLLSLAGSVADIGAGLAIGVSGQSLQTLAYALGAVLLLWFVAQFLATGLSASVLGLGLLVSAREIWPGFEGSGRQQQAMKEAQPLSIPLGLLAGLVAVLAGAAGWVLVQVADRADSRDTPEIIAHRGASAEAPENSLAAIELAIEQGADWVEIDVQQTRDREIVVMHDSDLMKVANVPLRVRDASLAELRAVDIGAATHPEFAGQRIPTLEEVLALVQGRSGLIIELKYYGGEVDFEAQVASIFERAGKKTRVQFMSLKLGGVRALKSLRPDWNVGLLSSIGVGDLNRLDVDFFAVNARLAARRFVRDAQSEGRRVYAWTVNDPALMSTMASREVDGIITDYPGVAARVLAERAELDLHELLIINAASLMGSSFDVAQ